jgi:hypothetical protein
LDPLEIGFGDDIEVALDGAQWWDVGLAEMTLPSRDSACVVSANIFLSYENEGNSNNTLRNINILQRMNLLLSLLLLLVLFHFQFISSFFILSSHSA